MRIVTYARISRERETSSQLANQRERLAKWCEATGNVLAGHAEDGDISGAVPPLRRDGFRGAIVMLESGQADAIAVVAFDRVARSVPDLLWTLDEFKKRGWEFISLRESFDTSTAVGRLFLTMCAAFAAFERDIVSERTRFALAARKERGLVVDGRTVPYGYKVGDDGKMQPNTFERAVVDAIIRLRRDGKSYEVIAEKLNETFHVDPRTGRPFIRRRISKIIQTLLRRGEISAEARHELFLPTVPVRLGSKIVERKLPSLLTETMEKRSEAAAAEAAAPDPSTTDALDEA